MAQRIWEADTAMPTLFCTQCGRENPDVNALQGIFASAGLYPKAVMRRLEW